jgi:hypothetical protein
VKVGKTLCHGNLREIHGISTLDIPLICLPLGQQTFVQLLDFQFSPQKSIEALYGIVQVLKEASILPLKKIGIFRGSLFFQNSDPSP